MAAEFWRVPNVRFYPLGRVDKADPLFDGDQLDEAEEAACGMIVSGGDAPTVLEPVEEALDPVSGRIQGPVDSVLDVPVLLGGNFGCAAPGANLVANGVTVVSLVGQHDLGIGVVLGHEVREGRAVVGLPGRQEERDWKTLSVGPGVDFGREATARAAKSTDAVAAYRKHGKAAFTAVIARIEVGETQRSVARSYNVSQTTISRLAP